MPGTTVLVPQLGISEAGWPAPVVSLSKRHVSLSNIVEAPVEARDKLLSSVASRSFRLEVYGLPTVARRPVLGWLVAIVWHPSWQGGNSKVVRVLSAGSFSYGGKVL